jgi:prepilin-type N-terminal cleavage/methylation domain-containing protein
MMMAAEERAGYTILEVLIAVIILAIVLPGLATMVISSRTAQTATLRSEQAAAFGQLITDSLQLVPSVAYQDSAVTRSIGGTNYTARWRRLASTGSNAKYTAAWTLSDTVSWNQGKLRHSVVVQGVLR